MSYETPGLLKVLLPRQANPLTQRLVLQGQINVLMIASVGSKQVFSNKKQHFEIIFLLLRLYSTSAEGL